MLKGVGLILQVEVVETEDSLVVEEGQIAEQVALVDMKTIPAVDLRKVDWVVSKLNRLSNFHHLLIEFI